MTDDIDSIDGAEQSVDPTSFNLGASDHQSGKGKGENPFSESESPLNHSSWLKGWNFNKENS